MIADNRFYVYTYSLPTGIPFYGKHHSAESKVKMKNAQLKVKERHEAEGKEHWNKNRKASPETIQKLSVERTCPHCNKVGKGTVMFRHHFDKCKLKGNN